MSLQLLFSFAQGLFGSFALFNFLLELAVGFGQLGGPFCHQLFKMIVIFF